MVEPDKVFMTCANGHRSMTANANFCMVCGAPLTTIAAQQIIPQQVVPLSPQMYAGQNPYQQHPVSALPLNNYPQPGYGSLPIPIPYAKQCQQCGGDGRQLNPDTLTCKECAWLRPLFPGYAMDCSAFQWSEDGKAMAALRSISPLNAAARTISDKVGRRWVETTFNGVLLSENQLPDIYAQAVQAARILGMSHMPDVYVSGERMWDCLTYGSDKDSFIIIGTALATNFRGPELLFLLAREMGHCRAGHALWKTVIRFLLGEQGPRKGLMSGGLLAALSPTALVEGALEMPLLAWARQAEITADRAGLIAVGDEAVARRVLLSWTLKSPFLYNQINISAWLEQQATGDDQFTKLSELTTSSTPYITRRLNLLTGFAASPELKQWQAVIGRYAMPPAPAPAVNVHAQQPRSANPASGQNQTDAISNAQRSSQSVSPLDEEKKPQTSQANNDMRMACAACSTPMRVPSRLLEGKQQLSIRCPNAQCGKVVILKRKPSPASPRVQTPAETLHQSERNLSNADE